MFSSFRYRGSNLWKYMHVLFEGWSVMWHERTNQQPGIFDAPVNNTIFVSKDYMALILS